MRHLDGVHDTRGRGAARCPCGQQLQRGLLRLAAALSSLIRQRSYAAPGAASSDISRSSARTSSADFMAEQPARPAASDPSAQCRRSPQPACCRWRGQQGRCRPWQRAQQCPNSAATSAAEAAQSPTQTPKSGSGRWAASDACVPATGERTTPCQSHPSHVACPLWPCRNAVALNGLAPSRQEKKRRKQKKGDRKRKRDRKEKHQKKKSHKSKRRRRESSDSSSASD